MRTPVSLSLVTCGALLVCAGAASAQTPDRAYRGMLLCEKMRASPDILHVPLDLIVRGNDVQFARPIFNFNGQRVLGSELGIGTVDGGGKVHLTSSWYFRGVIYSGDYTGMLHGGGGTMSGTQSWAGPNGGGSRTCTAALVLAPQSAQASAPPRRDGTAAPQDEEDKQ